MASQSDPCAASPGVRSAYKPIMELTHPLKDKVLAFWHDRPVDGIVIGRDVPSRVIASLLSRVIVHEPIDGDRDLKVGVAGGGIVRLFGTDIPGKTMSELFPTPDFAERRESVLKAIREGTPQYADCVLSAGNIEMLHTELVILPVYAPNHVDVWGMTVCCFFN